MANAYTNQFLDAKRVEGDATADAFIASCFQNSESKNGLYSWLQQLNTNSSLQPIPQQFQQFEFISASKLLPVWASQKQLQVGSAFFVKHAGQIMQLLGVLSLPYCYAAADGAMVLYLTERLRNDVGKRLAETAEFIWGVMSPDAFETNGKAFAACFKIRLMHAAARHYTLKSGKWDMAWGIPINQEDMAGTNLSFSLIVIRGLRKLGYTISYAEQQSFLHLWNVIAWLLGGTETLIPQQGKAAAALELAIRERHFKTSEQGRTLTKTLLTYLTSFLPPSGSDKNVYQLMRYLLGNEVSNLLEIPLTQVPLFLPPVLKIRSNFPNLVTGDSAKVLYQQQYNAFKNQNV